MKRRYLSAIIALHTIATLTGCGGGSGGADEPTQHVDAPTARSTPLDPRGLWSGTTTSGRVVSGVVTTATITSASAGNYWLAYALTSGGPIVGFYAGSGAVTPTTGLNGTFASANLRDVSFNTGGTGTVLVGATAASFTAQSTLSGPLNSVTVGAGIFDITGAFPVTATIFGSQLTVPFTVNSGTYDSVSGTGSWNVSGDVSGMGFGVITFDQAFTLNATTGLGTLGVGTNCVGNGIACGGVGPNFNGPINAGGAIVAGVQNWIVTTPQFGSPVFAPTLTENLLPSIPADAISLTYNNASTTIPSVAELAGNYNGTVGTGTTLSVPGATFDIDSTGAITGSGNACNYTGTASVPSPATGNFYNVTLTVSNCSDAGTYTGVAIFDGINHVTVMAMTAARDKGFLFDGS